MSSCMLETGPWTDDEVSPAEAEKIMEEKMLAECRRCQKSDCTGCWIAEEN